MNAAAVTNRPIRPLPTPESGSRVGLPGGHFRLAKSQADMQTPVSRDAAEQDSATEPVTDLPGAGGAGVIRPGTIRPLAPHESPRNASAVRSGRLHSC